MTTDSVSSASFVNASVNAQNPWLGLHSFTEELQEFFYGRDGEADELQRRVNRKTLTVLFGQSGLGKTSLLRAGLYPRLRRAGFLPFTVRVVHSTEAPPPAAQIIAAFVAAATAAKATLQSPHDGQETSLWEYFHHVGFSVLSEAGRPLVPVMVFDQFEEVFTLGAETESLRQRGVALLTEVADLVENRPPKELLEQFEATPELVEQFQFDRAGYRVLLSLREDYLANLEDVRARMPSLSENRMRLTRMNGEQALDAVSKPGGHLVSPAVSRQIVRFVAGAAPADADRTDVDLTQDEVDPAMLSLFCAELNNRRRAQELPQITAGLLAGSRETILQDYYERCLADAHPEVRRFVEDELLTEQGFRVDVPLEKAQKTLIKKGAADDALDDLVKRRLLRIEERLHVRRVELTHDVLTSIVRQSRDERQQREEAAIASQREEHIRRQLRKARKRLAATVIAAASIVAILGAGFYLYLDWWVWPHDSYYNTFSKRRGGIVGIGELSEANRAARANSFKITRIGRGANSRVVAMAAVNNLGELTAEHGVSTYLSYANELDAPEPARECRWEYIYDNDGRVIYEKAFDKHGKMAWCFVYSPTAGTKMAGDQIVETAHGHFIGDDGYPRPQRNSSAEYVEIQYSPEGWEHVRKYSDRNGRPQPGMDRAYGMQREYDEHGRMTKTLSLDEGGRPMIDSAGNCGLTYGDFDALGNSRRSTSIGTLGELMPVSSGWTIERQEYDEHGNNTSTRYFDAADRPVRIDDGYAGYLSSYDPQGHIIKRSYLDEQGNLTTGTSGYAGWTARYDNRGLEIERRYFGADAKPTRSRWGNAIIRYEYDTNGLVTKQSFFDTEGKPTLTTEAIAGWASQYDGQGLEKRRSFFNADGEPTLINTDNTAGWSAEYDDRGNRVKKTSLGLDGRPGRNSNGYVTEEARYDDFGNQVWVRYLDQSGQPSKHKEGYAGFQAEFDGRGNRVKFLAFDESEKPQRFKGAYGWTSEFDKVGNETTRRFVDRSGNSAEHVDGYASWTATYDSFGHETERRLFDLSGKPASTYAHYTVKYNRQGRALTLAYFAESGKPAATADGYSRVEYEYDAAGRMRKSTYCFDVRPHPDGYRRLALSLNEQGLVVEIESQDAAGKPIRDVNRIARIKQERNSRGLVSRRSYFDPEGKPTVDVDGIAGWTANHDLRGKEIERRYFDLAGKPTLDSTGVAVTLVKYDDRGNPVERRFLDRSNKPVLNVNEVHGWTSHYDDRNNEVEQKYFDASERPTRIKFGYWKWTAKYNELGKVVERAYWDDAGKPAASQDGSSRTVYEYDDSGRERRRLIYYQVQPHTDGYDAEAVDFDQVGQVVARAFYDAGGRPMLSKKGVARGTFERDSKGRIIRQAFYDLKGRLTLSNEGVAGATFKYDDRGNETERRFFDAEGNPQTLPKVTFAGWTSKYDDNDKLIERSYFDKSDKPATLNDGYSRIGYEYDGAGREIKRTYYYDVRPHQGGYAAEVWTFNEKSQNSSISFLDAQGRPMLNDNLISSIGYQRDGKGRIKRQEFFDARGQATLSNEQIAGWESKYDDRGNEIERRHFDVDGMPKARDNDSYVGWEKVYDSYDHVTDESYFDADGKPAASSDGWSRAVREYDSKGHLKHATYKFEDPSAAQSYRESLYAYDDRENVTEIRFIDDDGKPVRSDGDYYRITFDYNTSGKMTRKRVHFDIRDSPDGGRGAVNPTDVARRYPYAYVDYEYVAGDKLQAVSYYDLDDDLTKGPDGWAQRIVDFDEGGVECASVYKDENGAPVVVEVRIGDIAHGSPAEKLNLHIDDVLTTYEGLPITDASSFSYRLHSDERKEGKRPLGVRRGEEEFSVDVEDAELGVSLIDRVPHASEPKVGDDLEPATPSAE